MIIIIIIKITINMTIIMIITMIMIKNPACLHYIAYKKNISWCKKHTTPDDQIEIEKNPH